MLHSEFKTLGLFFFGEEVYPGRVPNDKTLHLCLISTATIHEKFLGICLYSSNQG